MNPLQNKWESRRIDEELDDTKWGIRIRKSKKDRQNGQRKIKTKRTNNDLQNIHIKLKDKQRSTKHTHKTKGQITIYKTYT